MELLKELRYELAILQDALPAITALQTRVDQGKGVRARLTVHIGWVRARSFTALAARFSEAISGPLKELETALSLICRAVDARSSAVARLADARAALLEEITQVKQQHQVAVAEAQQIAGHFLPEVPTDTRLSENITAYGCVADQAAQFELQRQWEPVARRYNNTLTRVTELTAQLAANRQEAHSSRAEFNSQMLNATVRTFAREIGVTTNSAVGPVRLYTQPLAAQNSRVLSAEQLLLGDSRAGVTGLAALLADFSPKEQAEFVARNHWLLADHPAVPWQMRQQAAQQSLSVALNDPETAYVALGFNGGGLELAYFKKEIHSLQEVLSLAAAPSLLALGRHGGQLTAQLVHGNLSRAGTVAVLVPGMGSGVGGAKNTATAAHSLRVATTERGADVAVITWLGYDSPNLIEEPWLEHARAGGAMLARDLQGLQREIPDARLHVIGHSYGSTTAAEALSLLPQPVDSFITVGSAGLATNTTADRLAAARIYATTAAPEAESWGIELKPGDYLSPTNALRTQLASDNIAPYGMAFGEHMTDPRSLKGAVTLPANRLTDPGLPVGSHSLHSDNPNGLLDAGYGYFNLGTQSLNAIANVLADAAQAATPAADT